MHSWCKYPEARDEDDKIEEDDDDELYEDGWDEWDLEDMVGLEEQAGLGTKPSRAHFSIGLCEKLGPIA